MASVPIAGGRFVIIGGASLVGSATAGRARLREDRSRCRKLRRLTPGAQR